LSQDLLLVAKLSWRYVMQGLRVHANTHYLESNMHHPLQLGRKLAAARFLKACGIDDQGMETSQSK